MEFLLTKLFKTAQSALAVATIIFGILMPTEIACKPGVSYAGIAVCCTCGLTVIFSTIGLARIAEKFREQNTEFSDSNKRLSENLKKQEKINISLVEIQKHSQKLMEALMQSGDEFKEFNKILSETTTKNLSLADKMTDLLKGLTKETFAKYDKNGDGFITIDELEN